jgi:endonuclease III
MVQRQLPSRTLNDPCIAYIGMKKRPFDIPTMFSLIRKAIQPYARAMLFEIRDDGHASVYEQLVACLLSIRTRDETSLIVARKVFQKARTPQEMLRMDLDELAGLIKACTFPYQKAKSILEISRIALSQYDDGKIPCDFQALTALPGVGPKCANLVLGIACEIPSIGVDIHVHRITNRWGYVEASTPEKSLKSLEKILPSDRWIEINELLVPFGKHICTGSLPKCPTCPVLAYCRQIGVDSVKAMPPKYKKSHSEQASKNL